MNQPIEARARFDIIRYANCWEDADILVKALEPSAGKRFLSIGSAGDNALALVAAGAEVVAVDLSSAQLACIELRCAAFTHLDYGELLAFLGVQPTTNRLATYQKLRDSLPEKSRQYWDSRPEAIEPGVIHQGKFEHYFGKFRRYLLPWIHSRRSIAQWLGPQSHKQRLEFYQNVWNNWRWRMMFKLFFSRGVMGRLGRDPEFFRYVEGSIGQRLLERTRYALCELDTHRNPYLVYILTGNFNLQALPRYLREEHFEPIRRGLTRLTVCTGAIDTVALQNAGTHGTQFDGFNLSDIFEYMSPELTSEVYGKLVASARKGARLVYWNMMVPRGRPESYAHQVVSEPQRAESLFGEDQAWFYSKFVIDRVL